MMTLLDVAVGQVDNLPIHQLTLTNSTGQEIKLLNYGITIQSWKVKTRENKYKDVLLGFDEWTEYLKEHPNFGCIIGRCANRIREGHLEINGLSYPLSKNLQGHHLHGGFSGFGKKVWQIQSAVVNNHDIVIHFLYKSPSGEEGYPGNLNTEVVVRFTEQNELVFEMKATTDHDTVCNLSQHNYFNLGNTDQILDHEMQIFSKELTETDRDLIPTGVLNNVQDTPFDFSRPKEIGASMDEKNPFLIFANGYDVNYVLDSARDPKQDEVATVKENENHLQLDVYTSLPGLQLYTGNWLEGTIGKNKNPYKKFGGFCLEPQFFPDSPHHKNFPDIVLRAGEVYQHWIKYKITIQN